MNQERILVVEDEPKIAELHRDYLEQSGFQVSILGRGDEVVSRIQKEPADLILLDLMLPGKSGEEVCRNLRTFSNIPIIMVTAKTEEIDRLLGLELGADDYICKPFSPREVVARVKAVLRRSRATGNGCHCKFAMLTASACGLIFYSGIIVTGVSFAFGFTKSGIGFLNTNFKWLMAIRSLIGCLGSVFFILGFKSLTLADAFVIASLLPVASAILAFFLFNEHVSILAWPAMLIG